MFYKFQDSPSTSVDDISKEKKPFKRVFRVGPHRVHLTSVTRASVDVNARTRAHAHARAHARVRACACAYVRVTYSCIRTRKCYGLQVGCQLNLRCASASVVKIRVRPHGYSFSGLGSWSPVVQSNCHTSCSLLKAPRCHVTAWNTSSSPLPCKASLSTTHTSCPASGVPVGAGLSVARPRLLAPRPRAFLCVAGSGCS